MINFTKNGLLIETFLTLTKAKKNDNVDWYLVSRGFKNYCSLLLQEAVYRIYVIDYDRIIEQEPSLFPKVLKKTLYEADKNYKIWKKVKKFLNPFIEEFPIQKEKGTLIINEENIFLQELSKYLYHFLIATKHKIQLDIDLVHLKTILKKLKTKSKNEEINFLIDRLIGIFNSYQKIEIDVLNSNEIWYSQENLNKHIKDILDDSEFTTLSKNRYFLGIPSKIYISQKKIKRNVRDLCYRWNTNNNIKIIKSIINLALNVTDFPSLKIPILDFKLSEYAPPISSLERYEKKSVEKGESPVMHVLNIYGFSDIHQVAIKNQYLFK